jgi:uncharacterized protein with HEPN domain
VIGSFTRRPRVGAESAAPDRWPALQESFVEAVIIHVDDLLGRLRDDRAARLPSALSLAAVRKTRNIRSHDYRSARAEIVWDVVEQRIPQVILAVID